MTLAWFQNDELFRKLVAEGHKREEYVAARLREEGFNAWRTEKSVRQDVSEVPNYASEVDVEVEKYGGGTVGIEVKGSSDTFTCPMDDPRPHRIVTTKSSWDQCNRKPSAVLILSDHTGHILAISPASTRQHWRVWIGPDKVRGIERETYYRAARRYFRPFFVFCNALEQHCPREPLT